MAAKHQMKNRNLSIQALEDRNMFAGNILANMVGTELTVAGDVMNNQVQIEEIAPNTIQVTGLMGTTVNGAPMQVFAASLIEDVSVRTGDGNDLVVIRNLTLSDTPDGDLKVFMSSGDDQVYLERIHTTQSIELDTGDHNDKVMALRVGTDGIWNTNSGNGHDRVGMRMVQAKDMKVDMLDGNDKLRIQVAKAANDLQVHTGTENDTVRIEQVGVGNDIQVITDKGTDRVLIRAVRAGNDVRVDTGDDADTAVLKMVHAQRDVFAGTGDGNDLLIMDRIRAQNQLGVDLHSGDDQAYIMRSKAHDVKVEAGDGHDDVYMEDVNAIQDLYAHLGSGNDVFRISNSTAANPSFDGGLDNDTIYDLPNAFDEIWASINFEVVL